jgi:hypothetical protein
MHCKQNIFANAFKEWGTKTWLMVTKSTWYGTDKKQTSTSLSLHSYCPYLQMPSCYLDFYFPVFAFLLPIFANAFLSSSCRYKPIKDAKLRSESLTHDTGMNTNLQQNSIYLVKYLEFFLLLFSNKHPVQGQVILNSVWLRTMWGRYGLLLQKGQFGNGQVTKKKTNYEELNYKAHRHLLLSLPLANFSALQGQVSNKGPCRLWNLE